MSYEYKMVQISSDLIVSAKARQGNEAADYMQQVIDKEAVGDWEFYRVDSISVEEQPGCIAGLIGMASTHYNYHVIAFRRKRTANSGAQSSSRNKGRLERHSSKTDVVESIMLPEDSEESKNDSGKTNQELYF